MFKILPAGRGMSMLQSDPMPTEKAKAKMDALNAEADEMDTGEEQAEEPMGEKPGAAMPPFGKRAMAPMGDLARLRGGPQQGPALPAKPAMPPFGGM